MIAVGGGQYISIVASWWCCNLTRGLNEVRQKINGGALRNT